MIVIDAYAWIEYFKGSKKGEKAKKYIENEETITPTVVLAELSDKYFREGCKSWDQDLRFILAKSDLAELTKDIAINSGRTKNLIRKTSPDFGLADAIIYETAKQFNASMVTGDRHFKNLENVIFLE